ncbi:MAG TPA: glycosyltransferase family 4 protein, partial [Vicinamibacterales bacterium]
MRLCIPIPIRSEGGLYTFIGTLTAWLDRQGIAYTDDPDADYDVLFANSWAVDYALLRRAKRAHPSIVIAHRVDGSAADYGGNPDADRAQARVNLLADVTIFQSRYSYHSTREKFPVIAHDGPIIYNPVDTERFNPRGPKIDLPAGMPKVACASFSTNRRKGNWQINDIAAANPGVLFVLCGRFDGITDRANIVRLGHLDRDGMAAALRSCDVFLSLTENDAMPNVVLEALASGLPVIYRASGGVPEVVGDCGAAMEAAEFAAALQQVQAKPQLSTAARQRAEREFAPDVILPQYIDAFSKAVRRDEPTTADVVSLWRAGYPVMPQVRLKRAIGAGLSRTGLRRRPRVAARARVGWITYDSFPRRKTRLSELDSFTVMRAGNVAQWINHHHPEIHNELYAPDRRYDIVVFQKMMDARCQDEAGAIHNYGGKVIFDANVNYYDIEGDYFIPGTQPTAQQQQ